MSNQTQPFGIDISKWQGKVDFGKLAKATPKVQFVAMRLGISFAYVDEQFYANMQGVGGLGLHRIAYHVPYFHVDGKAQVDHIMSTLDKTDFDPRYDRVAMDAEQNNGMTKSGVTQKTAQILDLLKKELGRYPMIYSRGNWVDTWLDVSQLPDVDWWLATYRTATAGFTPEHLGPPVLPKGVTTWLIHQTGSRNDGRKYGMESEFLDSNRWNGTVEQMNAYFGRDEETPPEPPIPPETKLFDAKVVTTPPNRLRTRYTPAGLVRPEADWLPSQAIVPVYETHSTGWWRVADEAWSSATWMQRVDDLPLPPPVTVLSPYYGALYFQRDVRWKDKPLGSSTSTIGGYGCAVVSETNCLCQLGINTNPVINNAWRTANGGYRNGNLIVWEKVSEQHPGIIWEGKTWNPTDAQIKQKIADGCPLVMLVDHNEGTSILDEHWVNSIPSPVDDDAIWIHDPWDNATIRLRDRYKKPMLQFSSYRRQA